MLSTPLFSLEAHPTARSRAVTKGRKSLREGITVLSSLPISTVLDFQEKGRRCDCCLRVMQTKLQRCTGCKIYWYCDATCQMIAWKAHHRRLCKHLPLFTKSSAYEDLSLSEKLHSLLLSHLLAEHADELLSTFPEATSLPEDLTNPISILFSLIPQRTHKHMAPIIPIDGVSDSLVTSLSSRFANNNFTIHSAKMIVFAHGIFPLASRSFNHSCWPSAVPMYSMSDGTRHLKMEVKLIRDLEPGEEITIPYVDPALPRSTRQRDLELTYNFTCQCSLCRLPSPALPPPSLAAELAIFEGSLREYAQQYLRQSTSFSKFRGEFLSIFHPSYLPSLATAFSDASHDGHYAVGIEKGVALLAVYFIMYPPNYPMIGLHALELSKTCWNAFVTDAAPPEILQEIKTYLAVAERTFSVVCGEDTGTADEGDQPLSEVKLLQGMLRAEM